MYNLTGKTALVTGAAHKEGLGRACALRLAAEGADVAVVDIEPTPPLSGDEERIGWRGLLSVVEEIKALGRRGLAIAADISDSKAVNAMVRKMLDEFGKIDILVNNAAFKGSHENTIDHPEENWNRVIGVNLTGTFLCSKAVGKAMVERGRGGRIINIDSYVGKVGWARRVAYSASKFGILSLTQTMAQELAQYGINVNAVCPGSIDTAQMMDYFAEEAEKKGITIEQAKAEFFGPRLALTPIRRMGKPEEIASAVAFFASDQSDFITGQALSVDGGRIMGK